MLAQRPRAFVGACLAVGVVLGSGLTSAPMPSLPQQAPTFRGRTIVVPVDVRVLDRSGKPVTDLKAEDFTVTENGVRQKVEYFSTQALAPAEPDPNVSVRPTSGATNSLAPRNRRLFLICLGRGRLQEPSKGLDATLRFVRERLLPQDQVAVMAWNRATDFTTDKAKATVVIERFRKLHEGVDQELRLYFSGLVGLYAGTKIPGHIQKMIDEVFDPAVVADIRAVVPTGATRQTEADLKRATDAVLNRSQLETFRMFGGTDARMADGMMDPTFSMSFEDFIVLNRQTMDDLGNLYAGIDYLRYIEGEKHLVFVTEQGVYLPRAEHERDLASMASDARVALNTIQTGGVAASQDPSSGAVTVSNGFQLRALREMSDISGGQSSISNPAEAAYDRILNSTAFGYLLGYTPPNDADGRRRQIRVEVNRKNVSVAHRRAYIARSTDTPYDPRASLAATRLMSAAGFPQDVNDLRFTAKLTNVREGPERLVNVELAIDATRLRFGWSGDRHVAALNFAVFAMDSYGNEVGQVWSSKDIFIPESRLAEIQKGDLTVTLRVPVKQQPVRVRIIAYDYGSDLLGSTTKNMR